MDNTKATTMPTYTLAVTGASGFVGRTLVRRAIDRGYRVIALGRSPGRDTFPAGVEVRAFDPSSERPDPRAFDGADAVIHLAGESIDGRWTPEKKRRIEQSRIQGTRNTISALARGTRRPRSFICASATGYYGSRGDEPLFENAMPGSDFLAGVCVAWEREAMRACEHGMRAAMLRTGIVLGEGGALKALRTPFLLGAGGPLGSGRQLMPWIHVHDLADLYLFAVENERLEGPVNAVAPDYATNARFTQAIGAALQRPALLPAPAPALHLALGEFASSILASQLVIPAAAADAGFAWQHPDLEGAIAAALAPAAKPSGVHHFHAEQLVRAGLDDVFTFFADARNLEEITPPLLRFTIDRIPEQMTRGTLIDYRLRLHGLPLKWRTLIAQWTPPYGFVDVQLHGPYASWRHEHRFTETPDGVLIQDDVRYVLPLRPFDRLAERLVRTDVEQIFHHRKGIIEQTFAAAAPAARPPYLRPAGGRQ